MSPRKGINVGMHLFPVLLTSMELSDCEGALLCVPDFNLMPTKKSSRDSRLGSLDPSCCSALPLYCSHVLCRRRNQSCTRLLECASVQRPSFDGTDRHARILRSGRGS